MHMMPDCICCIVRRQTAFAAAQGDTGLAYLRRVLQAICDAPADASSPYMTAEFQKLAAEHYGLRGDLYAEEKAASNAFMRSRMEQIRQRISADPLPMALRYARACNYIDFSALQDSFRYETLDSLLDQAANDPLDPVELAQLTHELAAAKRLVYLCDNAGEIVADRLTAEVLREQYPRLEITFAVRGAPVSNDALMADALAAGLDQFGQVLDSGSGIPGTVLSRVRPALRQALDEADVILAKGLGNFETLCGCGKNIYYLFLCKCVRFQKMFGVPPLTGMFVNERRLPTLPAGY